MLSDIIAALGSAKDQAGTAINTLLEDELGLINSSNRLIVRGLSEAGSIIIDGYFWPYPATITISRAKRWKAVAVRGTAGDVKWDAGEAAAKISITTYVAELAPGVFSGEKVIKLAQRFEELNRVLSRVGSLPITNPILAYNKITDVGWVSLELRPRKATEKAFDLALNLEQVIHRRLVLNRGDVS